MAFRRGWHPKPAPVRRNGRKIAVVGAGPAGLACAERLVRGGCEVTVYDKNPQIGGLLATGVPAFKLNKAVLERRRVTLEKAGVRFRLGVEVDGRLMGKRLTQHDTVFLGTGAQRPRPVELPGRELPGIREALAFLAEVNSSPSPALNERRVLVLGGGDTAMDCARSALRLGAASVTVAYRRGEENMRASPKEIKAAREEGVRFLFHHRPLAILGDGEARAVRFETAEGEYVQPCDLAIFAFGFVADPPAWLARLGIAVEENGRIQIDGQGRTTHPRVYAGGDILTGRALLTFSLLIAGPGLAHHTLTGIDLCSVSAQVLPPGVDRLPQPDSEGASLVKRYCTQCHQLPGPGQHTGEEWPAVVERMNLLIGVASRFGGGQVSAPSLEELDALRAYLVAHALQPPGRTPTEAATVSDTAAGRRAWALVPIFALVALGLIRWRSSPRRT